MAETQQIEQKKKQHIDEQVYLNRSVYTCIYTVHAHTIFIGPLALFQELRKLESCRICPL